MINQSRPPPSVPVLAIALAALCGCSQPVKLSDDPRDTKSLTPIFSTARREDFVPIPTSEVPATQRQAEAGDLRAINKLIVYYLQNDQDEAAQKWGERRDKILRNRKAGSP